MKEEIEKEISEAVKLKKMTELFNHSTTIHKEEFPDKIVWGKADSRKDFKFNSDNLDESINRLDNFFKVLEKIGKKEQSTEVKVDG